jgi:hypothetical protein
MPGHNGDFVAIAAKLPRLLTFSAWAPLPPWRNNESVLCTIRRLTPQKPKL